jgi:hypothetical protein
MRHSFSYRDWLRSSNAEVAPLDEFIDGVMSILKNQPDAKEWSGWEPRHGRWGWDHDLGGVFSGGAQRALPTYKSASKKSIRNAGPVRTFVAESGNPLSRSSLVTRHFC